jgi:hypothetical protein
MESKLFERLLLKTAFCCMASDGNIDKRELKILENVFSKLNLINQIEFRNEINSLVVDINNKGAEFFKTYFSELMKADLNIEEELKIIDIAIQTINADEIIEYSEVKFFKNIRYRLKITDEKIKEKYADIEMFLEQDIITENYIDKISVQYFEDMNLPQFELIINQEK